MHPGTFDFWSAETCRDTLEFKQLNNRSLLEVSSMDYYSDFYFDFDEDRRLEFTDLYRVNTVEDSDEGIEDRTFTVAFVDGEPKWFGNCDLPVGI